MVIKETKALSMAEAGELAEEQDIKSFIKKFTKMKFSDAEKMREELEKLDSVKMNSEHVAKIIDLMPEDAQDLAKIFNEISLDDNETTQILEIVKKYK